jgi:hypothetical protein
MGFYGRRRLSLRCSISRNRPLSPYMRANSGAADPVDQERRPRGVRLSMNRPKKPSISPRTNQGCFIGGVSYMDARRIPSAKFRVGRLWTGDG